MKEQFEKRLEELKAEFESGRKVLTELEMKEANLRETLLRISGAIQVIEEELEKISGFDEQALVDQSVPLDQTSGLNSQHADPTAIAP